MEMKLQTILTILGTPILIFMVYRYIRQEIEGYKENIQRGRRFVRAYLFIILLEDGCSVDEANSAAMLAFSEYSDADSDRRDIGLAKSYAAANYSGKQLPVINEAVSKGFIG